MTRVECEALREVLGLTPQQAKVLAALYDAGRPMRGYELLEAIQSEAPEATTSLIKVQIYHIRRRLPKFSIVNDGRGYALTATGTACVAVAIARRAA